MAIYQKVNIPSVRALMKQKAQEKTAEFVESHSDDLIIKHAAAWIKYESLVQSDSEKLALDALSMPLGAIEATGLNPRRAAQAGGAAIGGYGTYKALQSANLPPWLKALITGGGAYAGMKGGEGLQKYLSGL